MRACKYCTAPIYPLWPNMCMALAQWPQPQAAQLLQLGLGEELIGGVHRSVVPWPETSASYTSASYSILWLLRLIHCALTLRHGSTPGLRRTPGSLVPRCSKMFQVDGCQVWLRARRNFEHSDAQMLAPDELLLAPVSQGALRGSCRLWVVGEILGELSLKPKVVAKPQTCLTHSHMVVSAHWPHVHSCCFFNDCCL